MDPSVAERLSGLSKRQLLDALNAVVGNAACTAPATVSLKEFLNCLPIPRGSSRTALDEAPSKEENTNSVDKAESQPAPASFNLSKYRTRQIAMQVQYDGTAYLGFASQDLEETVENHLFNALIKLKLIEDRKSCQYSRCGRTDKGVSALGQVISVNVRSALPKELSDEAWAVLKHPHGKYTVTEPAPTASTDSTTNTTTNNNTTTTTDTSDKEPPRKKSKKSTNTTTNNNTTPKTKTLAEMDYVTMLNRALPDDIRILGWCEVTDEFSARFSASDRKYRYFFQRKDLNIRAMQQAASYLLGNHDFRNLCKMDIANVSNFRRDIYSAEIKKFEPERMDGLEQYMSSHSNTNNSNSNTSNTNNSNTSTNSNSNSNSTNSNSDSGMEVTTTDNTTDGPDVVYMLEIKGIAFLWHMVRCIMAVLFMVGEGLEEPEVVHYLLNTEVCTGKPPYPLAPEQPLVLHECGFDNLYIPRQPRHLWQLTSHYRSILENHLVSAARARNSLELVMKTIVRKGEVADFVEGLLEKDAVHAKRQGYKNAANKAVNSSIVSGSVGGSVGGSVSGVSAGVSGVGGASAGAGTSGSDSNNSGNSGDEVVWKEVLERVRGDWGLVPKDKYVPHVPLAQRRKEDSYEVKIAQLAGVKKERLTRHVELSSTAATTGATPLFFQKMRQQGSL